MSKVEIDRGCYSENIYINGEYFEEDDKIAPFTAIQLCHKIIKNDPIQALKLLVETYGNTEYDEEPCEQCGHTGSKVTYEIE